MTEEEKQNIHSIKQLKKPIPTSLLYKCQKIRYASKRNLLTISFGTHKLLASY